MGITQMTSFANRRTGTSDEQTNQPRIDAKARLPPTYK